MVFHRDSSTLPRSRPARVGGRPHSLMIATGALELSSSVNSAATDDQAECP